MGKCASAESTKPKKYIPEDTLDRYLGRCLNGSSSRNSYSKPNIRLVGYISQFYRRGCRNLYFNDVWQVRKQTEIFLMLTLIMDLKQYLDSTYLKTAAQAGLSEEENLKVAEQCIDEAIAEGFKLVMIRPEVVSLARKKVDAAKSEVLVGTVIDFPEGNSEVSEKLKEAQQAIENGADELDFVIDYKAFKSGNSQKAKQEVYECTKLGLDHNKVVKWIIEVAALTSMEIVQLSALIKNVIISRFDESDYENVFVKSSTGFYKTPDGEPNGATVESIKLMIENSFPLPVKAAGGVRSFEEAQQMIRLGVKRIGTSSAKAIIDGEIAQGGY